MLPEGNEDRIIKAADYLLERDIVDLIIVGDENAILARGQELGLKSLGKAKFQAKDDETVLEPMVAKLCELRAKKGMTEEQARKQLADDSYFGTMLLVHGMADGSRPFRQLHGQYRASGPAGHQDQARNIVGIRSVPDVFQGPCRRVRRLCHQP